MKEKEENNSKRKRLIIILIIIIIFLLIYNIIKNNTRSNENEIVETNNVEIQEENKLKELASKSELDRMHYYIDKYISYLEQHNYQEAYNLLYYEFKELYFPTLEKFTEYAKKKYPEVWGVSYDEYDTLGKYYILKINVLDILNENESYARDFSQKFVIMENGLDDFYLSFQAE